jgi:hypothetical protein
LHGRLKARCKDCDGHLLCEKHGVLKIICVPCRGSLICEHDTLRYKCIICVGGGICIEHNCQKYTCKECKGPGRCKDHNRIKSRCVDCNGTSICEHRVMKRACKICSPLICLMSNQRHSIRRLFDNSELIKENNSIDYLGCNSEYFINYIKSKMTLEMTFQNIHIDHIKPISAFDLDDDMQFLQCAHYTNLQPLLVKDNLSKGDKWSEKDEKFWKENICGKEYLPIYMVK